MNLFTVLLPYLILIGAIFLLKPFMSISKYLATITSPAFNLRVQRGAERQWAAKTGKRNHFLIINLKRYIIFGLLLFSFLMVFAYFLQYLIKPNSTENYQTNLKNANVVIAFGFGMEEDNHGNILAGKANDSIMKWVKENTNAKFIIAQKACILSEYINPNAQIIEMHAYSSKYVNTLEASTFALQKLDSLSEYKIIQNNIVVVVAHDFHLKRAAWIMNKLSKYRTHKTKYQFIIPNMPQIPFPSNSVQMHTRNKYIYTLIELYISRPRDYFKIIINQYN
jgi:uncharacterized SAM-binding protein YcdF (DUF218 family)